MDDWIYLPAKFNERSAEGLKDVSKSGTTADCWKWASMASTPTDTCATEKGTRVRVATRARQIIAV